MTKSELVEKFRNDVEALQEALEQFEAGGLRRRTLVVLLHDKTKLAKRTIHTLLNGIDDAVDYYFGDEDDS